MSQVCRHPYLHAHIKKGGLERIRTFYITVFRRCPLLCDHQSASTGLTPLHWALRYPAFSSAWRKIEGSACIPDTSALICLPPMLNMLQLLLTSPHLKKRIGEDSNLLYRHLSAAPAPVRPSIRLFYDDAAKVMIMCSARANRFYFLFPSILL